MAETGYLIESFLACIHAGGSRVKIEGTRWFGPPAAKLLLSEYRDGTEHLMASDRPCASLFVPMCLSLRRHPDAIPL